MGYYFRERDELFDLEFARECNGETSPHRTMHVADSFSQLWTQLSATYELSNDTTPNSCLILPASEELTDLLLQASTPPILLDPSLSAHLALPLRGKARTPQTSSYKEFGSELGSVKGPCIAYLAEGEIDNKDLQTALISDGKPYAVAYTTEDKAPLPSHFEPHRWG